MLYLALCTAASGKTPVVWNFQLTQPHADLKLPTTIGQWALYADTLEALYALAAPAEARAEVRHAACRLLTIALRKGYVDGITEPLRKHIRVEEQTGQVQSARDRDKRAQWARACMLFFRACEERARESHEDSCFFELDTIARDRRAAIASSLLRHAPRARMREYTRALCAVAARTAYNEQRVRAAGARYFARYSGGFADAKRATIAQNDTTALYARRHEARPRDERVYADRRAIGVDVARATPGIGHRRHAATRGRRARRSARCYGESRHRGSYKSLVLYA
jgi:hypothetical protein